MKLPLISITAFCISLSSLPAWANTLQSAPSTQSVPSIMESMPQATQPQTTDAAVEPAALTTQGSAADLTVEERSPSAPTSDRAETLNVMAEQINQNLSSPSEQQQSSPNTIGESLSLPQGVVIRGVNRGGVAIGSEIQ